MTNNMRQNTNTREFSRKVQKTLLDHFDSAETLKNEIKHYAKNFEHNYGITMVEYGNFDCYYNQVADTMAQWFNCTVDEIWAYYKDNSQKLWANYMRIVAREIGYINENKRVFI